jgi:hypothetical protein
MQFAKFHAIWWIFKMAAQCLDASLETLRPLCYRRTLRLQGDLCHCFHKGSPQALHAVVTLSARHFLQKQPTVYCPRFWGLHYPKANSRRSWSPSRFRHSHSWVFLAFWAGPDSCWKTHSRPLNKVMLRCFTAPCSTSSWYTRTPVSPLSCKNEDVTELMTRPSSAASPVFIPGEDIRVYVVQ